MLRLVFLRLAALVLSLLLAVLAFPGASLAVPISWNNAAGGNWNTPGNWSPAQVPTSTDDVTIDLAGTYTVTIDTSPTVASLAIGGASGTQTLLAAARTITVNGAFVVSANGSLDFSSCTLSGTGSLTHSGTSSRLLSTTVDLPLTNNSTLHVQRSGTWNGAYTSGPGSTLKVESEAGVGSTLTVASAFANNGTLELITISSTGPSSLTWNSGTLVNPVGSTLLLSAGTGGVRTLTGPLSNAGTLTVNAASTLAGAGADHVNTATGVIDLVSGNLTITQTGATPSFTNNGTLTVSTGRTLTVTGGEFVHASAGLSGAGTFSMSSVTLTQSVDYLTSALAISPTTSTFNGPGTFRNSSGVNSLLFSGCVVNSAIVNDGTLRVQRSGTWNGAYTSGPGSTLKVESEAGVGSTLTVASAFANNGTLELITISSTGPSSLTWNSGTLVNPVGSTLLLSAGTGGVRTLTGPLSNAGTLTVNAASTLAGAGADHVNTATGVIDLVSGNLTITQTGATPSFTNNGTLTVSTGRTLTVTGGEFVHASAGLSGAGTFSMSSVTLTQSVDYLTSALAISPTTSTFNGPGTFRNSSGVNSLLFSGCVVNSAIVNDGTLRVQRSGTWNGAYTSGPGSTLKVESEAGVGSTLTVASAFANNGTLELITISSTGPSSLTWNSGTLVNPVGSTLLLSAGTGGVRTLTGPLSNAGTLTVNAASTLAGAGADHVNTATGVIDLVSGNLTITQTGATPSFTNNGTLTVSTGRTLTVTGGEFVHASAGLSGAGTFSMSSVTLTQSVDYLTSALAISPTTSTFNGPGTFRNSSGVNSLLFSGCVVNSAIVNDGTLRVQRSGTWNGAYTSGPGSTLKVESEAGVGSTLTVASAFANNGTLELITISSTGPSSLTWNSGTLVNPVGSTLLLSAGTGGARTLTGPLSNAGTLTVNAASTLAGAGADHVNTATGVIDLVSGNLTITQTGATPSFTNNGTLTVSTGRTLTVTGGEFVHASANLSGAGTFSIASVSLTQTVDYVTGTLAIAATNSTLNGPGTFRNSSGVNSLLFSGCTVNSALVNDGTLLFYNCVVNSALVNDGTLRVQGGGTWNGAYTSGTGSTLKVESASGVGSTLTVASGFTNRGTLELITISGTTPSSLTWNSGTLVNPVGSTLLLSAGTGGVRTLTGPLSNAGTLTVNAASTLAGAGADHVNAGSGTIDLVAGNLTITQTGATPSFTNEGTLTIGATRVLTVGGGTFANAAGGTIRGNGTLNVTGTTFTNGGNINPGTSAGSLTITGPCPVDSSGAVNIELGGVNPGTEYDRLTVSGTLTLKAPVNISLINGFSPTPGQTFQILNFGSNVRASLPWITGLDLGNGISLYPQVGATSITLLAVGQTWVRLLPVGGPPPARERHAAAYNPASDRMIVFGGLSDAGPRNDVWVLSGADGQAGIPAWTQLSPTGGPPSARESHSAVYDPGSNTLVVFGGDDAAGIPVANAEVWVLSGADGTVGTPSWTQLAPSGSAPSARTGPSAVYDAAGNRMIVFGGDDDPPCGTGLNDVWVLTNANGTGGTPTWSQLTPTGSLPSPRAHALATYDGATNRMTMIGGLSPCDSSNNEMWVLADANGIGSPAWSQSSPNGSPPSPWSLQSGVYDPVTNRVTTFGGLVGGVPANLVLTITDGNGTGSPVWVDLTPTSGPPDPRSLHSAVQAGGQRMVVFGGAGASGRLADVWVLEETQGRVVSVTPDPASRSRVIGFSRPPWPNPGRGGMHCEVALARAQRVELEIWDVSGRRVAALHHGFLDAGEHTFDWRGSTDVGARAPAGLYFLSLKTEELRQVRKFVLTH